MKFKQILCRILKGHCVDINRVASNFMIDDFNVQSKVNCKCLACGYTWTDSCISTLKLSDFLAKKNRDQNAREDQEMGEE